MEPQLKEDFSIDYLITKILTKKQHQGILIYSKAPNEAIKIPSI